MERICHSEPQAKNLVLFSKNGGILRFAQDDGSAFLLQRLEDLCDGRIRRDDQGLVPRAECLFRHVESAHEFVEIRLLRGVVAGAFKDAGVADVEGFVVCPPESWEWVSEPLPEACVLYVSAADSVCTKTDAHGYFRFDGIKDKTGKVSVSREKYKSVEAAVPPEDGSRWLWLRSERDQ